MDIDLKLICSSFIAGSVQTILGHPLDTLKTRIQLDNRKLSIVYKNFIKKENILYLYKGSLAPLIGISFLNCFLFTYHYNINNKINNHFISGFTTGIISGMVLSPFELIKCNLQHNRNNYNIKYKNIIKNLKKKNIKLNQILYLSILRDSIGLSIYFGVYEKLQKKNNNPIIHGGIAGVFSWIYSYPIDVIKTKNQVYKENIVTILKKNNIKQILTNGLGISLIRAYIVNSGIFYTFENLKNYDLF